MKEKQTVFERLVRKKSINSLGIFVQFVLLVALSIIMVSTLFVSEFQIIAKILLVLLLFTMGYNNHKTFKRKGFTVFYVATGFAFLFTIVFG